MTRSVFDVIRERNSEIMTQAKFSLVKERVAAFMAATENDVIAWGVAREIAPGLGISEPRFGDGRRSDMDRLEGQVRRALNQLADEGLIRRHTRYGRSVVFQRADVYDAAQASQDAARAAEQRRREDLLSPWHAAGLTSVRLGPAHAEKDDIVIPAADVSRVIRLMTAPLME